MGIPHLRKGILGGTFNPVHVGHLHLAQVALRSLELDQLVFIPSSSPPHKSAVGLCPFKHRRAMLDIATAAYPPFVVSSIEARRVGFSYTIDTLRELQAESSGKDELFFIMGFDAFEEMGSWKDYRHIPDYATIAVCQRDGNDIGVVAKRLFGTGASGVQHLEMAEKQVSSSLVRQMLAGDRLAVKPHLPPGVWAYIEDHGLFR